MLVAYTTSMANNGQNLADLSAITPIYNVTTAGTLPTDAALFALLTIGTVLVVGALSYLPVLALGRLVEQLGLR